MEESMMNEGFQQMTSKASGVMQQMKDAVKDASQTVMDKFRDYKGNILEIAVYAGIGFIVGFLLRKYLKYILLLVLIVVSIVILEQFDIIHTNVNWEKLQELFNIQQTTDSFNAKALGSYVEWAKANLVIVVSTSVGFLVGLKLG